MKRIITYLLCGGLLCASFPTISRCADPPRDPKASLVLGCIYVTIVVGTGYCLWRAFKSIKCCLDRMFSNRNGTNSQFTALLSGSTNYGPITFQSSAGLGSAWVNRCVVNLQEAGTNIVAVLMHDGVVIDTHTIPMVTNADGNVYVFADFSDYTPPSPTGDCPSSQFMRLSE